MDTLVKQALVGTAKQASIKLEEEHDVMQILSPLPVGDIEGRLLMMAGACSLYEQAGRRADSDVAELSIAPKSGRAIRSFALANMLTAALNAPRNELLIGFLAAIKKSQLELPYELLPQALNVTDPLVRQHLLPILGERGRWLSQFNSRWEWVTQGISAISSLDRTALRRAWDEGKLAERALALSVIRRSDSAEGRHWLEEVLPNEKADVRVALVEQLQHGLSGDDEELLENLLDDRSEQVKQLAASLLCQLPASAFVKRMQDRAQTMMLMARSKLSAHPPEELPKDWVRDGISAKVPAGRGKRAFWLEEVLASVPLNFWTSHFKTDPVGLLEAVRGEDLADDVIAAWTRAIGSYQVDNAERLMWTHALWNYWLDRWNREKKKDARLLGWLSILLKLFSATTAEQQVLSFLTPGRLDALGLVQLLGVLPEPWSKTFGEQYLKLARQVVATGVIDQAYEWGKTLEIAGHAMPPSLFGQALEPWDHERSGEKSWTAKALAQEVEQFCEIIKFRQLFQEELSRVQKENR